MLVDGVRKRGTQEGIRIMSKEETGKATESYVTELHISTRHEMLLG
jgi:hypothetical protein